MTKFQQQMLDWFSRSYDDEYFGVAETLDGRLVGLCRIQMRQEGAGKCIMAIERVLGDLNLVASGLTLEEFKTKWKTTALDDDEAEQLKKLLALGV